MPLIQIAPIDALNKAFRKQKPTVAALDAFRAATVKLLDSARDGETEEFHKNLISAFLKEAGFGAEYFINTKGRTDLVVHLGPTPDDPVGVLIEVKSPRNRAEMPTSRSLDRKACHELLLYFLRGRLVEGNLELRSLVVTNLDEWFVFDAQDFERNFVADADLVARFKSFEAATLSGTTTDFFYREIASPALRNPAKDLRFAYFRLSDFGRSLRGSGDPWTKSGIALAKMFTPEYLLKRPPASDGQTLNRQFYAELLHIVGLKEIKKSGKRLIAREEPGDRRPGALLELAIAQLEALDKISRVSTREQYGRTEEEQLFGVALELVITWVNRILFLKLLEAQLDAYHGDQGRRSFLTPAFIASFDDLNTLFFQVLARKPEERRADLASRFAHVPYLNSSLFEPAAIEHETLFVSNLADADIAVFPRTSVIDSQGARRSESRPVLEYLLRFLDSYDFGAEETDSDIRAERKSLITASVLGLLFEKINGYKDGAYFTPGVVTMHMCRTVIRQAVVDRFNMRFGWSCGSLADVYERIDDKDAANAVVNGIRICDPAVGSGHFLVSALNELIAIKSELKILRDTAGRTLRDYEVQVLNDELVVIDDDGARFRYVPGNEESHRVQEALFLEKQRIIEDCLFGVDLNSNSVKICRLRLWIELLKCAYYKADGASRALETLPNIDINIKVGDSLVSRFALDAALGATLKKAGYSVTQYKAAVHDYQRVRDRQSKRVLEQLIQTIRAEIGSAIQSTTVNRLRGELVGLEAQHVLFAEGREKAAERRRRIARLKRAIAEVEGARELLQVYRATFEWRFEFPGVLDEEGAFQGFDIVIGNPPYGVSIDRSLRAAVEKRLGKVPDVEIYYFFINLGREILRMGGRLSYIVPNTMLFNMYAKRYRESLLEAWEVEDLTDCTDFAIFEEATVRNLIFVFRKSRPSPNVRYRSVANAESLPALLNRPLRSAPREVFVEHIKNWSLIFRVPTEYLELAASIRGRCRPLATRFPQISQGLIAYDRHTGQSPEIIASRALHSSVQRDARDRKWLRGEDVAPFCVRWNGTEFIQYGDEGGDIANPRRPELFVGPRVLVREITGPWIYAGVAEEELYHDPAVIVVKGGDAVVSVYCLTAILNSRLATFYHLNSSPKIAKGEFPKILVDDLRNFPIPATIDPETAMELDHRSRELSSDRDFIGHSSRRDALQAVDALVERLYALDDVERSVLQKFSDAHLSRRREAVFGAHG